MRQGLNMLEVELSRGLIRTWNENCSFNSAEASKMAMSMFSIEVITKMVLYYFHERIWVRSNFGVIKKQV